MERDIAYGKHQEDKLFQVIRREFGDDLVKTRWSATFDYENAGTQVELKSRRCCRDTYPTTMVGMNKIRCAEQSSRRTVFCFKFQDGLYYWDYHPEQYITAQGGRCDRGRNEIKDYAFIKTSYLKNISI